ncbi:hypothetical protein LguiA_012059 [Lonicera macranthoides]
MKRSFLDRKLLHKEEFSGTIAGLCLIGDGESGEIQSYRNLFLQLSRVLF